MIIKMGYGAQGGMMKKNRLCVSSGSTFGNGQRILYTVEPSYYQNNYRNPFTEVSSSIQLIDLSPLAYNNYSDYVYYRDLVKF